MSTPKLSAPLTKALRTSEGVLVWLTNLGLAAGAVVDPSTLPAKEAAIVGSVLTGLHVASRTLVKVTALQQGVGLPAPSAPSGVAFEDVERVVRTVLPQALEDVRGASAAKIYDQAVSDAEEFASQPAATVADSPRPESAIKPDAPAQAALQAAPVTTVADVAAQTVVGAAPATPGA